MGAVEKSSKARTMTWEERRKRTDRAVKAGVRAAILEHKLHGRPIVVDRDGKIVEIPASEIVVDEDPGSK